MATYTRLDCAIGTSGLMPRGGSGLTYASHVAFGKRLIEQPLMKNVLADLAIESEAAAVLVLRLAHAFDEQENEAEGTAAPAGSGRHAGSVSAVRRSRRSHGSAGRQRLCGGIRHAARLPRNALNSIWEGSGSVMCLDVLRAAARGKRAFEVYFAEFAKAQGSDARLDRFVAGLQKELAAPGDKETSARRLVEGLALALQGALLIRHAPAAVADAFCASRLAGDRGGAFGTLPASVAFDSIIERAWPTSDLA
jgi:putative acyl-CoA dehydrogenase